LFLLALTACGGHEVDFARSLAVRTPADLILRNGKVVTMDRDFSIKEALAIRDGRIVTVGGERDVRVLVGPATRVIDLKGRTVIPGLIDSHIQATVAGLSWDAELHWQMTRTLADALRQIATAAKARPAGSWIVVGGGWVPTQFAEKHFPTRADLDAVAPRHPVYVQYLRQGALLNSAALKAIGIATATPDPVGGKFERNPNSGELTGWLQGAPAWEYAYNKIPTLSLDRIRQSLRNCFRELNRLGLTSVGDLQTGAVSFAHRRVLADMARTGELTVRVNFYVTPGDGGDELEQIMLATGEIAHLPQSDLLRFAGFGPTLLRGVGEDYDPADSKGIALSAEAKEKFRRLTRFFAAGGHGFYLNAGQDTTARQLLDVLEEVQAVTPFQRQRIGFAQLEDVSPDTIARIKKLGGGISVQSRLALSGERRVELWGLEKARNAPPLRSMIESGIPLGAGSGAFHAATYSPMLSLWWLITGKTVAGSAIRSPSQNLTRAEALRLHTMGSAWLTFGERRKGSIEAEKLADLVVLSADYLTVPEEQIRSLESLLTIVGGRIVYAAGPFAKLER
jgi:predicted amidohydrolase YtcJ